MSEIPRLHARLEALSQKIFETKSKLKRRQEWHDGHLRTSKELVARYAELKTHIDEDIAQEKAMDHQVTNLEISLREWLADIEDRTR